MRLRAPLNLPFLTIAFLGLAIPAFAGPQATPRCAIEDSQADGRIGNAGCLVRNGSRMLVVRHRRSGRLVSPGGFSEAGEPAQCTAQRETWEETGLEVKVGPLLKRFDNGFLLYACRVSTEPAGTAIPQTLSVPVQAAGEVTRVLWIDPAGLRTEDWRFPEYLGETKRLFALVD